MSDFALAHKKHDISTKIQSTGLGIFVIFYCEDCLEELGHLNLWYILDKLEKPEEELEEDFDYNDVRKPSKSLLEY